MSSARFEPGSPGRKTPSTSSTPETAKRSIDSAMVVYIHGIGAQEPAVTLMRQYDKTLFNQDVGERSRLAYWADILHPMMSTESAAISAMSAGGMISDAAPNNDDLEQLLPDKAVWPKGMQTRVRSKDRFDHADSRRTMLDWGRRLSEQMLAAEVGGTERGMESKWHSESAGRFNAKVLPPGRLREWLTKQLTRSFLEDVYQYLFQPDVRQRIQARLRDVLVPEGGPYVVVSHSLGTVIAYDVLQQMSREPGNRLQVPLWITLGSPLGIAEVQDAIERGADGRLAAPPAVVEWRNFADPLDPIALDQTLADDFAVAAGQTIVDDHDFHNLMTQQIQGFNPHAALGYIGHSHIREVVRQKLGNQFAAPTAHFVIARDIATEMCGHSNRMSVLIEIQDDHRNAELTATIDARRQKLVEKLRGVVENDAEAKIDPLNRYVAAKLTPNEIARLRADHKDLSIRRIWKNSVKRAFMNVSALRLQTYTARKGFGASGVGIGWAVIDTGIAQDHPHFNADSKQPTIVAQWNCTLGRPLDAADAEVAQAVDDNGHGTHVAGLIAGYGKGIIHNEETELVGMAQLTKLHVYKVLDQHGEGDDAYIIKALDHIARTNEQAGRLVIHGVNLSLGGPFDASVYGCGHSPLCCELRRLWRMGVLVCVAAGNEGTLKVNSTSGDEVDLNVDLSIGDPANLEEAIAVGSVSRDFPHLYGVSYFSSRGPTADGRPKPDVVAPGEWIWSCNVRFDKDNSESYYVPDSGTSMATPMISGLLAAFLSVRREFIGRPDEVKRLLLQKTTDLGRDRNHQGAGLPNLVKMLTET